MNSHDDQNRGSHAEADDDDLLNTIRQMVSEEAARDLVEHPGHLAPGAETPAQTVRKADAPAKPAPLVLGALTRISEGEPPSKVTRIGAATPPADHATRGMVADLLREELHNAMEDLVRPAFLDAVDDAVEQRLRRLIREELKDLLARARDQ